MALEKQVVIDRIEIVEKDIIQVRRVTRILEDNTVISEAYDRWVLNPGQDVSDQDPKVQAVANAVWSK